MAVVAVAVLVMTMTQCSTTNPSPTTSSAISFRGDFETADTRQFSALECPNPARQFKIVRDPVRQGDYAARFEVAPGDNWTNGSIRCLIANYNSDEREGDDYYFAMSMYFPKEPSDNTIWELHSRSDIYSVDPDTSVAPHAIFSYQGGLRYRLLTGPAFWDGHTWTGWSHYEPSIPLLGSIPIGRWVDIVVHITFNHRDRGLLEVWCRAEGEGWTTEPQVRRRDVSTLQWIPGFDNLVFGQRNDPQIPADIYTSSLYVEMGLYPGVDTTDRTDAVYLDGYRRGSSLDSVMAEFP